MFRGFPHRFQVSAEGPALPGAVLVLFLLIPTERNPQEAEEWVCECAAWLLRSSLGLVNVL